MNRQAAVFLDRDGTLTEDRGYISNTDDVRFFPETFESLRRLSERFALFIVTNQSGIAKGLTSAEDVEKVNAYIDEQLGKNGVEILKTYCCPHDTEDGCLCRKPGPLFAEDARKNFGVDLSRSFMIGDHPSDVFFAMNNSMRGGVYVLSGHGRSHKGELLDKLPNAIIKEGIAEAAQYILSLEED